MSKIEWTETTWNPIIGCSRVSEGCRHCYAERMAVRLAANPATPEYQGIAESTAVGPRWTGDVRLVTSRLDAPMRWKKPRLIFVNSMSDLFHEKLTFAEIEAVFEVMRRTPQHTYQVLTKRPRKMAEFVRWCKDNHLAIGDAWPLPNVWGGVSVEDQATADERIRWLLQCGFTVSFLSCEPLLETLDLSEWLEPTNWVFVGYEDAEPELGEPLIDWVIVGGESGPGARPMHPDWVERIRAQCKLVGVPFFFKQWGEWGFVPDGVPIIKSNEIKTVGGSFVRFGKKANGRRYYGREYNEFPEDEHDQRIDYH